MFATFGSCASAPHQSHVAHLRHHERRTVDSPTSAGRSHQHRRPPSRCSSDAALRRRLGVVRHPGPTPSSPPSPGCRPSQRRCRPASPHRAGAGHRLPPGTSVVFGEGLMLRHLRVSHRHPMQESTRARIVTTNVYEITRPHPRAHSHPAPNMPSFTMLSDAPCGNDSVLSSSSGPDSVKSAVARLSTPSPRRCRPAFTA